MPRQSKYAPIFTNRFFTGLWSQRNPLRDAATQYLIEKFYAGARYDSLIGGLNLELTNKLTLKRRPGNPVYNDQFFPPISRFFEFRYNLGTGEVIKVMADTDLIVYDATGPSTQIAIFTKSVSAGQSYFQSVGSTLYFGDGVDQQKYLFNGTVWVTQNWGISLGSINNAIGPTQAGNGTNGGAIVWANPNNVTSNVAFATVNLSNSGGGFFTSGPDNATQFGFAVPAGEIIKGIVIQFTASKTGGSFAIFGYTAIQCQLLKNGSPVGNPIQTIINGTNTAYQVGSNTNLWGSSFTPNDINQSTWGVAISALTHNQEGGTVVVSLNGVFATISGAGGPIVTPTGTGSFAATKGYTYVFCFGNSLDRSASTATPAGNNTGAFSGKQGINVPLTASTDPQVNQIRVFRTTDGGVSFLELPTSPYPNVTATILDTAADAALNFELVADTTGINTPPPPGFLPMEYHLGRIWGAVGNIIYYSAGPDVNPGVGNGNTSFPPKNNFQMPSTVTSMVSTAIGLIIFTTSTPQIILGNGTASSPLYPQTYMKGKISGLLNFNSCDVNGTLIYLQTSNGKLQSLDLSSGVGEAGFPIGDLLKDFGSGQSYVTWHEGDSTDSALYVADPATGSWYRLNPTPAPETGMTWSPLAVIAGGFSAVQSIETSPGQHQLLIASNVLSLHLVSLDRLGTLVSASYDTLVTIPPTGIITIAGTNSDAVFAGTFPYTLLAPGLLQYNTVTTGTASGVGGTGTLNGQGGPILARDTTAFADGGTLPDNGTPYEAYADIGSIVLAHPGQIALIDSISTMCTAVGAHPLVSVLLNEIAAINGAAFELLGPSTPEPVELGLVPADSLYSERWYLSSTQEPALALHLQLRIAWAAEDFGNELLTYSIFGAHYQEL